MMNKVKITAVRKTEYPDLMAKYENPILHTCDVLLGQSWISEDGMESFSDYLEAELLWRQAFASVDCRGFVIPINWNSHVQ